MSLNVLVADDHAVVRRGIGNILDEADDMEMSGEAASGEEVLRMVREGTWDIVVLDIAMPGKSGIEVLREIKHLRPELPVLILSMYEADQYAVRMLKAGASGFINKETAPDVLVHAIHQIKKGKRYLTQQAAAALADHFSEPDSEPSHELLSDREFQVMCSLAEGKRIKDIASDLSLSPKTISTYRRRALDKLDLETDAELIHYVLQAGLVKPNKD